MQIVACDVKRICADCASISIRYAAAGQGCVIEAIEERESGFADGGVFVEKIFQLAIVGVGMRRVRVLIEPGQLGGVISGEAKRAVDVDAFIVDQVRDDFL